MDATVFFVLRLAPVAAFTAPLAALPFLVRASPAFWALLVAFFWPRLTVVSAPPATVLARLLVAVLRLAAGLERLAAARAGFAFLERALVLVFARLDAAATTRAR